MRCAPLLLALAAVPLAATATPNAAEGKKLMSEHKCETCHQKRVPGEAGAIYLRKDRRVNSWERLKAQVATCNAQLNLVLFPEDEEHIVAYLNETYYKFPAK